jgi:SepF-like predicted cell division protein (DUF552 family)
METHENLLSLFKSKSTEIQDENTMAPPQEKGNFLKNGIMSKLKNRKIQKKETSEEMSQEISLPKEEEEEEEEKEEVEVKKVEIYFEKEKEISQETKVENSPVVEFQSSSSFDESEDFLEIPQTVHTWEQVPWLKGNDPTNISQHPNILLHEEIIQFYKFLQPTELEMKLRKEFVDRITVLIFEIHETAKLEIFGSYAT